MENHILLIDDDEDEAVLLGMLLQHCGKKAVISQVMRFEQAVAYAQTSTHTPDLIFLDLRFPEMSGLDILDWIRKDSRLSDIPVIVWSHTASDDDVEQSQLRGGNYFLSKTAEQTDMRHSVNYICAHWLK